MTNSTFIAPAAGAHVIREGTNDYDTLAAWTAAAPGHAKPSPGKSGTAPGHTKSSNGKPAAPPGHTKPATGKLNLLVNGEPVHLGTGPDPLPMLLSGIDFLNTSGVGVIAIPCNSSHHWYAQMSERSAVPILHKAGDVPLRDVATAAGFHWGH